MRKLLVAVLLLTCATPVLPAFAVAASPSFDCDDARSEIEQMICGDDELAAMDVKLAKAFARALSKAPAGSVADLKTGQKSWRQQMLRCSRAADPRSCTVDLYNQRMESF